MLYRLLCLVRKELQALLNNRQGRMLLIMPVILQTALFPFAATPGAQQCPGHLR